MIDELKNTDKNAMGGENEPQSIKASYKQRKRKKKSRVFLRVVILVVAFCFVVFAGVILSDVFFGNSSGGAEPEIIVIKVSGQKIILNENKMTSLEELDKYLSELDKSGELSTVALINDTATPADPKVYNRVVKLLEKYGIVCETLPNSIATDDETSTPDEHIAQAVNDADVTETQQFTTLTAV